MSTPPRSLRRPPARTRTPATLAATLETYPGFLGSGWSFPPTFDRQRASVDIVSGDDDIREALWIILATRIGERIMLPTFGSNLSLEVFAGLSATVANEIANMVKNAIIEWEPRVTVIDVSVTQTDVAAGYVSISVDYQVRQTNSRSNLVFPYYILEATLAAPT